MAARVYKLVDRQPNQNMKIKLTLAKITSAAFLAAFKKLAADASLSVKDKYALARSMRDIDSHTGTYEDERIKLVKKFGVPQHVLLKRDLDELPAGTEHDASRVVLQTRLDAAVKAGDTQMGIDLLDEKAADQFYAAMKELLAVEVELYLDRLVKLTDATTLTATDLTHLVEIVEV